MRSKNKLERRNKGESTVFYNIQDSAKKGYEKVLFPSGNTASKVEGHITLEEFKKMNLEDVNSMKKGLYMEFSGEIISRLDS